jgi:hypothetical protein
MKFVTFHKNEFSSFSEKDHFWYILSFLFSKIFFAIYCEFNLQICKYKLNTLQKLREILHIKCFVPPLQKYLICKNFIIFYGMYI